MKMLISRYLGALSPNTSRQILPWTDLTTSSLTKQNLNNYKLDMNEQSGGTSYLSALSMADQMFSTKNILTHVKSGYL